MKNYRTHIVLLIIFVLLAGSLFSVIKNRPNNDNSVNGESIKERSIDASGKKPQNFSYDEAILYRCPAGDLIAASYVSNDATKVELSLPDKSPTILHQIEATSSTMYINDGGVTFWIENGNANVSDIKNQLLYKKCVLVTKESTADNPPQIEDTEGTSTTTTSLLSGKKFSWVDQTELEIPDSAILGNEIFVLNFATEKDFSVKTDCNTVAGGYKEDSAGSLVFSESVTTLMACGEETKEQQFLEKLRRVKTFIKSDSGISMPLDDGATLIFKLVE